MYSETKSYFDKEAVILENTCKYIIMFNNCETVSSILAMFSCAWFDEYVYYYNAWKKSLNLIYTAQNEKFIRVLNNVPSEFGNFKEFVSIIYSLSKRDYVRKMFLYTPFSRYEFIAKWFPQKNIKDEIEYEENIVKSLKKNRNVDIPFNEYQKISFYLDKTNFYY